MHPSHRSRTHQSELHKFPKLFIPSIMAEPAVNWTERLTTMNHEQYIIDVTIWNEKRTPNPQILFDYNNVLNAYEPRVLRDAARVPDVPYAIVSLLRTKGDNFNALRERSKKTGETIVALTVKIQGQKERVERCMKYKVMKLLHWNSKWAFDDKPHEWCKTQKSIPVLKRLKLDPSKKEVFMIPLE